MSDTTEQNIKILRHTKETNISIELNVNGSGNYENKTGIGFFDHMLDQFAYHSMIDLVTHCKGDLHVDDHHTVEDTGIALGQALKKTLGTKTGIKRYGSCCLPMDDALILSTLDISGRPYLNWQVGPLNAKVGSFDTELVVEFFRAFTTHSQITLHIIQQNGNNTHHIVEAAFKATARALRQAIEIDPRRTCSIPSTKGKI